MVDDPESEKVLAVSRGQFFAVDPAIFADALRLGFNEAIMLLVMASGTGRSQRFTKWAVHATEKYTGMGRKRAKDALNSLLLADLVSLAVPGVMPTYEIGYKPGEAPPPDAVWLPNSLVVGLPTGEVDAEGLPMRGTSPLARVRGIQNADALKLLFTLYQAHHLPDEGGVDRHALCCKYDGHRLYDRAEFTVWAFTSQSITARPDLLPAASFVTGKPKDTAWQSFFFRAVELLTDLGLLEFIPALVEAGENGEVIHTLTDTGGEPEERQVGDAMTRAAYALLDMKAARKVPKNAWLVPVHRHYGEVQVFGLARLVHRPRTKMTAAWYAKISRLTDVAKKYEQIAVAAQGNAKSSVA